MVTQHEGHHTASGPIARSPVEQLGTLKGEPINGPATTAAKPDNDISGLGYCVFISWVEPVDWLTGELFRPVRVCMHACIYDAAYQT
jgi:hypothetical protein